jgi:hypothetical protein
MVRRDTVNVYLTSGSIAVAISPIPVSVASAAGAFSVTSKPIPVSHFALVSSFPGLSDAFSQHLSLLLGQ